MNSDAPSRDAVAAVARRGDLVVIVNRTMVAVAHGEAYENLQITLGRASSVARTGLVKRYEVAQFAEADDREQKVRPQEQVLVVGADQVDVEAVLAQYRKRTWRTTTGADSDAICPYFSMKDARQAIKAWRYPES